MATIFRPKRSSPVDRSAGDRARHRQKIRSSIRDNIADIIADESIIGRSGDRVIKVPIKGIKEFRFVYGDNQGGVGEGAGEDVGRGDVIGQKPDQQSKQPGEGGDEAGVDYYETEVSIEELIQIMFEDLELPDLERKQLASIESERLKKRKGYRTVGLRVHLDRRRTVKEKLKRQRLLKRSRARDTGTRPDVTTEMRNRFHPEDLRYRHRTTDIHEESNAVVLCIMDTSGSMDTAKKYLARSFFFLLYQFVAKKYDAVEVVFIAHDIRAKEVSEDDFFHKGESGGTFVSSGYKKALDVISDRYHPELWNIYAFHCSDGDNFGSDNAAATQAVSDLCNIANLVGYGEIKPRGAGYYGSSLLDTFKRIESDNFQTVLIERKEDVWPSFKSLLGRDRDSE